MADLAALAVRLELQSQAFERGMQKASRSMNRMSKNTADMSLKLKAAAGAMNVLKRAMGPLIILFGTKSLFDFGKGAIALGDNLSKTAGAVGLTVESLQKYQFVSERAGVSTTQFNSNMTAFVKRMGELKNNTGPLVSGLKGVNDELLAQLKGAKNQDEAFRLVVAAMGNAATAADRARIANAAWSRSGVAMVNIASKTGDALEEMDKIAGELGATLSGENATAAVIMTDKMTTLAATVGNTVKSAFIEAASAVMYFFGVYTTSEGILRRSGEIAVEITEAEQAIAVLREKNAANPKAARALDNQIKAREKTIVALREEKAQLDAQIPTYNAAAEATVNLADAAEDVEEAFTSLNNSGVIKDFFTDADKQFDDLRKAAIAMEIYRLEAERTRNSAGMNLDFSSDGGQIKEEEKMITTLAEAWKKVQDELAITIDLNESLATNFKRIASDIINQILQIYLTSKILSALGIGGTPTANAHGNIFNHGAIQKFANGGVFGSPVLFPMAGGKTGLLGEAGPEAIMPLGRTRQGDLGVKMSINVHNNSASVVSVEEDGKGSVDVYIDQVTADIARGGGRISRSLERAYGLSRMGR